MSLFHIKAETVFILKKFAVKEFNTLKHIYLEPFHCQASSGCLNGKFQAVGS